MSNIINLVPAQSTANEILDNCKDEYADLLVLGWDDNNNLVARASTSLDNKDLLYMIELFKVALVTPQVEGLEYE